MDGIRTLLVLGMAALAGAVTGACSTPSEKYGLPPPSADEPYPNINMDPTQAPGQPAMTPEERAKAEAELERRAGKKPRAQ